MSRTDAAREAWVRRSAERHAALVEDVELLLAAGTSPEETARRLEVRGLSLARTLYRAGRPDLGRVIRRAHR